MKAPALRLESVSFWYPGSATPAIRNVSLEVGAGAILGLAGANESGKTTLCLLAAGLAPRFTGGRVEGRVEAMASAMLFESPRGQLTGIHDTVFEEVAFGPSNLGLDPAQVVAAAREALEASGVSDLAHRHPNFLSGGQRQLVALAAVLAMRPALLVLDEPLSRLDREARAAVAGAVARVAGGGTAMLIAEHDIGFLHTIAGSVHHL